MPRQLWIVLQHQNGVLHRAAIEAIAAGQRLAADLELSTSAVLLGRGLGELAEQVAQYDLARVLVADGEALESYTPGAYVGALTPALNNQAPDFVVFPHTYQSVDYMARLAQRSGAALLPEVVSYESSDQGVVWKRPILQGKMFARVRVKGEGTLLLSVQQGAFQADGAASGRAEVGELGTDLSSVTPDRELLGVEAAADDTVDLAAAPVVVAVGRGIGGADKLEIVNQLAAELSAEIGASRPVVDSGWLPRDRQIGSSGQTVAPKLYVAVGISGAIQHLVGMKAASCVVAINKDPGAPIFGVSTYGLVGDLHEIVPALTAALKDRD